MIEKKLNHNSPGEADIQMLDVAVIGAGAAGVGVGMALRHYGVETFTLLERDCIGAAFANWPAEMRFITPSFPSNPFGCPDLNTIAPEFSVAVDVGREHPSGAEYAAHLQRVVEEFEIPVQTGVHVTSIEMHGDEASGRYFHVRTHGETIRARFVIWAAGEFFYPRETLFPGAEYCLHNSRIKSYRELDGDGFVVIGGYESGIDAVAHLSALGRRVRVLDANTSWDERGLDPSLTLSPYTQERLETAMQTGLVELIGNTSVERVERTASGYLVGSADGRTFFSSYPPILATGFEGSLRLVESLFDRSPAGHVQVNEMDESTLTPGLFVCGPSLRHPKSNGEDFIFCFIYKFRGRLPIVAEAIAGRLGLDTQDGRDWYQAGAMYLNDLSCCEADCMC